MIIEDTEWISVKLHGQSFMLHQIRKMICKLKKKRCESAWLTYLFNLAMAMLSVRTGTPLSLLPKTFEAEKINIPKAPALGLLLERPVFKLYNERIASREDRDMIDFDLYKVNISLNLYVKCTYTYTEIG